MNVHLPTPLLGGLSPQTFMRRHWQRKPLLIRGAIPGFKPLVSRAELLRMACRDGVESRLIVRGLGPHQDGWSLERGPLKRQQIPSLQRPDWTLLVQGVDTHVDAVHDLMRRFRFVPDARLDDVMISYATAGGGVGPHTDNYDVFLLQAKGHRRWRIAKRYNPQRVPGVPLKILAHFEPEADYVLEPGDMLYLPPGYGHDGVALDECMTYSIGFRVASRQELALDVLQRMLDAARDDDSPLPAALSRLYGDASADAVGEPAAIPAELKAFTRDALARTWAALPAFDVALGESLTEPKPMTWFESSPHAGTEWITRGVRLHRASRALYDEHHFFINGEGFRVGGGDARLLRQLANARQLEARHLAAASASLMDQLDAWCEAGWVVPGAVNGV